MEERDNLRRDIDMKQEKTVLKKIGIWFGVICFILSLLLG